MSEASRPRRKGRGRPKATNPRGKRIELRITPATKAVIEREAKLHRMTVTGYLLRPVPVAAGPGKKRRAIADRDVLIRLLDQIREVGGDHMQLTHAYRATGEIPSREAWERQERAIQELRTALLKALGYAD